MEEEQPTVFSSNVTTCLAQCSSEVGQMSRQSQKDVAFGWVEASIDDTTRNKCAYMQMENVSRTSSQYPAIQIVTHALAKSYILGHINTGEGEIWTYKGHVTDKKGRCSARRAQTARTMPQNSLLPNAAHFGGGLVDTEPALSSWRTTKR